MADATPNFKTIFAEALERTDPAERAAYLATACGSHIVLRERIEALLTAHEEATRFLEPNATDPAVPAITLPGTGTVDLGTPTEARTSAPGMPLATEPSGGDPRLDGTVSMFPADEAPGRRGGFTAGQVIGGRYTLRGVLGEGGMGTVFQAEQTEPVKRLVALKLIKLGMDSRSVLARFDAERQALALMDHPNIAHVFDGGTTETGQPYFVMELVNGVPITEYCDRLRMPVQSRLELFISVCHAVQHAHQKGIIHRDLKPTNVLVTEVDGRATPKVIDFGVAKATEFKLTEQSLADAGAIVGTPAYMSPEQADPSSMDIDTRTDIYALGVILYELLTGSPPLDPKVLRHAALLEMLRIVRVVDPPRPSTRVSTAEVVSSIAESRSSEPARLQRALRGDLDWIVMKALEKDRTRRYDTATGFAADVLRHLASEPVQAAPPSRSYRLRKFVRKNQGAVVAASLVFLAILVGIAGTTWGFFREAQRVVERDRAIRVARARAEELKYHLSNSNFLLANIAYENNDISLAIDRLNDVPSDQRWWEWGYLKSLTNGGLLTLLGHDERVSGVSFSPDGTRVVTGSADTTAKVWDARTGSPILDLKGHIGAVAAVSFSPDGTRIVTGSADKTAKVWDARTGSPILELKGHTAPVTGVSFSPDGSRIVTGSRDKTAKVWDSRTGAPILVLEGHSRAVTGVSFSPDGARIVTGSADTTAKVWDAQTGVSILDLKGHSDTVSGVSFSPDGTRIVSSSLDETAKVWDAKTGAHILDLKGHADAVEDASFSPDGSRIVTSSYDETAKVWDARTGDSLLDLKGHTDTVYGVSFSPDGSRIVTGSGDTTAKVWDANSNSSVLDLKGHTGDVAGVSFSPDGSRIVTGSADKTAKVWDVHTNSCLLDLKGHKGAVAGVSFSLDGTRIVTGSADNTAKVWDAGTGAPILDLKGHTGAVTGVSFSPDGSRVVTGSRDAMARVWDVRTGVSILVLKGHTDAVSGVSFSPDGLRIVTSSADSTAKVWDAKTGAHVLDLKGHASGVNGIAFSPDGTRIVTGSHDGTAKVWDTRTGVLLLDLKGHANWVNSVSFSPDGTRVVTGCTDTTAKVWDARTGTALLDLKGHTNAVACVSFSPDGMRLATGSEDTTAKIWGIRTRSSLLDLKEDIDEVHSTPPISNTPLMSGYPPDAVWRR